MLTEIEREHLMDRMGLFGVRLSVELIRRRLRHVGRRAVRRAGRAQRAGSAASVLTRQFEQRSRVLKARSAMAVLSDVLRSGGCRDGDALTSAAERLTMTTHAFEEIRVLGDIRGGQSELRDEQRAELDRLLGGRGHDAASRLGLPGGATPEEIRAAALSALAQWRRTAEHPLSSRRTQLASRVVERTLEGIVAENTG